MLNGFLTKLLKPVVHKLVCESLEELRNAAPTTVGPYRIIKVMGASGAVYYRLEELTNGKWDKVCDSISGYGSEQKWSELLGIPIPEKPEEVNQYA